MENDTQIWHELREVTETCPSSPHYIRREKLHPNITWRKKIATDVRGKEYLQKRNPLWKNEEKLMGRKEESIIRRRKARTSGRRIKKRRNTLVESMREKRGRGINQFDSNAWSWKLKANKEWKKTIWKTTFIIFLLEGTLPFVFPHLNRFNHGHILVLQNRSTKVPPAPVASSRWWPGFKSWLCQKKKKKMAWDLNV